VSFNPVVRPVFGTRVMRLSSLVLAVSLAVVPAAEARLGDRGSMGSRGSNTFSAPPATQTAPRPAAPIERSITQPAAPQRPALGAPQQAQPQAAPSFARSFMGGLAGGCLGAGLFGLLSGHGFMGGMGGFMSLLGLLFQAALIAGLIFLVVRFFRRSAPQPAYVDQPVSTRAPLDMTPASAGGSGPALQPITISDHDYSDFERLLKAVQDAYSREDISALRTLATPEMVGFLGDDLAHNSQRGLVDKVSNVKLLQGDLAEAWHEHGTDYATVAMRFSFTNVMVERATDRVVEGNPNATQEAVEIWTFRRVPGGQWILSAVQREQ
jgi:predicted lipid-binding transport protein (Tim44 family)